MVSYSKLLVTGTLGSYNNKIGPMLSTCKLIGISLDSQTVTYLIVPMLN